jgi:hypothetical protein
MNKVTMMNIGERVEVKLLFDNRKKAIEFFSDFSNNNDMLEALIEDWPEDNAKKELEEQEDVEEDDNLVGRMVSTVSTECLYEFMHTIVNELESRCSSK